MVGERDEEDLPPGRSPTIVAASLVVFVVVVGLIVVGTGAVLGGLWALGHFDSSGVPAWILLLDALPFVVVPIALILILASRRR
jgi:uncharacterized membrane protein